MLRRGLIGFAVLGAMVCAVALTSGCDSREQQSVTEVRKSFAARASSGEIAVGTFATLAAGDVDRSTLELLDVRFDVGDEFLMHAERAQILVDPDADTMRLRFLNVTAVSTEADAADGVGIESRAELLSEPWRLSVDVVE
jgi:hypothetical protein